jgi:hypothetical protein
MNDKNPRAKLVPYVRKPALAVALASSMLFGVASACRADGLLISAPDLVATAGSSGAFDVLLTNTNSVGGASFDVASDAFILALSGPLDASFTAVSIDTVAAPYIYVLSGTTVPGGSPLSTDAFPNMQFTASDSEFAAPGFRLIGPGQSFGLAHVSYSIAADSRNGTDTISFLNVSLTDQNGMTFMPRESNGLISVIPEPSTLVPAATAVLIGLGVLWHRRRASGSSGSPR